MSFIRRLEDRINPLPLRDRIAHAVIRLNSQRDRLSQMEIRLRHRDEELFQRCIGAQLSKDVAHARMYANECSEIRKIAMIVMASELALEKAVLRLQTIEEFGDVMLQMAPVVAVVHETKGKIAGVVPHVANELDQVNSMLSDLSLEAGEPLNANTTIEATGEDAQKVLEETAAIAEEKLKERFPEIPKFEHEQAATPTPELATADAGNDGLNPDKVLEYVKTHDGDLDPQECAAKLGLTIEDVMSALLKLRNEGKVQIQT